MDRAYPSRINWENEPSLNTPINDVNLNKIDAAVYTIDGRVVGFDTTKANQSDLLSTIKTVDYNTTTGVFTFTYWNGQTFTVDLNIEAIPVSFSMSPQGVITMKTTDGSTYTADVSSLIKTTTLQSSAQISWTATTDSSGNKTWTGTIVLGSITESMLQPNFLADCRAEKTAAQQAADISEAERLKSEGWARGTQDGEAVGPTSPYYHDNAKYWKEQAAAIGSQSFAGLTDVEFTDLQNGEIPVYNSTTHKWENGQAASPIEVIDELNSTSAEDALSANQGRVLKEGIDDLNTDLTKYATEDLLGSFNPAGTVNVDTTKYKKLRVELSWYGGLIASAESRSNTTPIRVSGFVDSSTNIVQVSIVVTATTIKSTLQFITGVLEQSGIYVKVYGVTLN